MKRFALMVAAGLALGVGHVAAAEEKKADGKAPEVVTDKIAVPGTTVEFKMVKIPAGKVTIKDKDGKDVEVEVKPFWIGQTEVTWPEYDVFSLALDLPEKDRKGAMNEKGGTIIRQRPSPPYEPPDRGWGHVGYAAGSIFDREAIRYCAWLSKLTGQKYRLPTEAEWEYAARAGGPPVKPEGKDLDDVAWYEANSDQETHPVGKKKPNAWGLYDTLGNVAEWVVLLDKEAKHPNALAGGSFQDEAPDVHSGAREHYNLKKWQQKDPQEPKGWSWLSSGPQAGFRLVREE